MKPDVYTKSVLTVIAASLLSLCVQNTVHSPAVSAQEVAQRVVIVGYDFSSGISDWRNGRGLPVEIRSITPTNGGPSLPVMLKGINLPSNADNGPLPVEIRPNRNPNQNPLPVQVQQPAGMPVPVTGPFGGGPLGITGSVRIDGGSVSIDGPVTVRQAAPAAPKAPPPTPSKK